MIIENEIVENITLIPENDKLAKVSIDYGLFSNRGFLKGISKMQITLKYKAWADEKAEHTREYVSILRRPATQ